MFGTGAWALSICPTQTMVPTARQRASPPRAATFLSMICWTESGVTVALGPATAAAASATAHSGPVIASSASRSGLDNERIVQLGVHGHLVDRHRVSSFAPV